MVFLSPDRKGLAKAGFVRPLGVAGGADLVVLLLIGTVAVLVVHGVQQMDRPLTQLQLHPVILDLARLPGYALLTTLRMFAAILCSLVFTFVAGLLAAKSRKAAMVVVPALDILQSVPVLGFLTFTVAFFLNLFPGRELGAECASIFAVFTAQAWNMAFSFYQSLRTLPGDLDQAARQFGLSPWRRFLRLELPFAMPGLIWNMMMSMSGAWFFVVASEAITVGKTTITLPGIGSWLALAIEHKDIAAVAEGVATMAVVIVLYDQLMFRPIVAWADKFRFEQTASQEQPKSWLYDLIRRTRLLRQLFTPLSWLVSLLSVAQWRPPTVPPLRLSKNGEQIISWAWIALVAAATLGAFAVIWTYLSRSLTFADVLAASGYAMATLLRVIVLIALTSLVWVPIGVWIGLRPAWAARLQPIAQFLAAFPANVLFPFAVAVIVGLRLNPNIWLSPLMVLGTQWYILFNVIAGASVMPGDLKEAAGIFGIRGWQWWRQVALPAIFPYYVTGAITASGGSWNASIVAEAVSWGDKHIEAAGLGAYIARATAAGDFPRVALGVAVMSVVVIAFNRILWRPLYSYAERRLRLD